MEAFEMIMFRVVAIACFLCLGAVVYQACGLLHAMAQGVWRRTVLPLVDESRIDERLPADDRRIGSGLGDARTFYDREIIDAYDEAILQGRPPCNDVTYRVVARRTGAHFGDVRSMLESMVPDRGGQEGDLSA